MSGVRAKKAIRRAYPGEIPPEFTSSSPAAKAQSLTNTLRKIPGKLFQTGREGPLPSPWGLQGNGLEFAAQEGLAGEWGGARARGTGAEYLQWTGTGKELQNSRVLSPHALGGRGR